MEQLTLKEQETKAFLELQKNYEMALEEIKALRQEVQFLQAQVYGGSTQ